MESILIIDDSRFQRNILSRMIASMGYGVMLAESGKQGLEMINDNPPDCIMTDLLMPVMDGFGLLKEIQNKKILIPVIVITADIQESVKEECLSLGASAFINKPVKGAELGAVVKACLISRRKNEWEEPK